MDIDLKKLNDDELISLCILKGIEYQNPKTKKNYTKSTLITRIKKLNDNKEEEVKKEVKEEEVKIEYKNEIIWKLSNEDKKNNDEYNEIENKLISCIKSCHDILYSNGSITGLKASNDIIKIIICRLFNIIYKNDEIKQIILKIVEIETLNKYDKYLIDIKEFNKNDGNIDNDIKMFILKILVPIFPNIFSKNEDIYFNTRNNPTNYSKIINKICELIDINNDSCNLFIKLFSETGGNMYEYFTNSYGKGSTSKELGQFFTPFKLINLIIYNIKDYISTDNKDLLLYDPCCGSGGLLNRTATSLNINRDNIYGCEIEKDTIKYTLASLLVNNNSLQINILNRCSLTNNNYLFENKKFDLILTNPPFGTKMNYKDLNSKFDEYRDLYYKNSNIKFQDVYPINTNNGASLFILHVIHLLKEDGGICGIVLPDGNELASKSYYNIRKYLIDNCKILKVINVSGGTFGSTGVKTKVLIFKKEKNNDKTNHMNIKFLEINKNCDELKLITTTDLDENYSFRLKINQEEISEKEGIENIEFGKMSDLIKGTIQSSKVVEDINGEGVFINLSKNQDFKKIKDYKLNGKNIFISNVSPLGLIQYYNGKCDYSNLLYHIQLKDNYQDKINIKFIYYILNRKQEFIENNYQLGCANKTLDIENFNLMKIPIPSLKVQKEIVDILDGVNNRMNDDIKYMEILKELTNKIIHN